MGTEILDILCLQTNLVCLDSHLSRKLDGETQETMCDVAFENGGKKYVNGSGLENHHNGKKGGKPAKSFMNVKIFDRDSDYKGKVPLSSEPNQLL